MRQPMQSAFSDIGAGLRLRRVWVALASEDIGDQFRRTMLGPIWMLINYFAFLAIFVFLFDRGGGIANFPAYAGGGLLVWFFLMDTVVSSVTLFTREQSFIKGTTLPLSVYVMRLLMQNLIRSAYALAGFAVVLAWTGLVPQWQWAWALVGIAVVIATAPAAIILFAFLGAYFPDSQYIVSNAMRIGMFVTPVFWAPTEAGGRGIRIFYEWNPFTHFLEIVREPILTGAAPVHSLAICLAIAIPLWLVALWLLGRYRSQVVFVL
jgi:ABC-type polysaccharide/polyol phosphate export permease